MRTARALSGLLALQVLLAGCGGDDSGGSANSGGASAPEVSQPLQGRAPSKASQFVGTWVFATEGDYLGFEFMKDNKVLVTHALSALTGGGSGTMMTYDVLEGGRLSLTAPTGQTQVFEATLSGDQMELKGGQMFSRDGSQRFRRLKAGQTLTQAIAEREQAEAKAYQERVEALAKLFQQPNLVIAFTEAGPSAAGSIALDIQASSAGFTGKAWHDDKPPHLNAISGQFSLDQDDKAATVTVTFGQRISPPATQPDGGGRITMAVTGDPKNLHVSSQVTFGSGPAREMVLRPDPKLHAQIVKRYEGELARIESLKQPMIEILKDYALLQGQLQPMDQRKTEPDTTELILVRDSKSGEYWCEGVYIGTRDRGELVTRGAAEIAVTNDRPVLRIVSPPARQYLLSLPDPKTPKLAGQWTMGGYGQGHSAQFDVVETLDAKARDAKFESHRKTLRSLNGAFVGLAHEDSASGMDMPIPVRLQIAVGPDGTATGKADYPSKSTLMTLAGQVAETPAGPRLQLKFTAAESTPGDQIFFRSIQNGTWSILPAAGAGPMKLTGYFTGPPLRTTTLTLANEETLAHLRKKLVEAMGEGGQFLAARFVGWQSTIGWPQNAVPTVVEWKLDPASNKVTGGVVTDGRVLGTNDKAVTTYEGQVTRENDWITLKLMQTMPWGRNKGVSALKLFVCEDTDGVLHLNGAMVGLASIPLEQPLPAFPERLDRLVEFVPVASTDAVTQAAVARAIADVEKAKADALAAAEAKDKAALDARRTAMAPYFPLFQAKTGLVVTTDAPAEMGAVLLTAEVDEEKVTVAGRGIDLREMPFREFAYECDLDNRGNLKLTTSVSETPYVFANPTETGASGRYMALTLLSEADRTRLDKLIALGKGLQSAAQAVLTVETLDAAAAKAREASLQAGSLPGIAIYRDRKNDQVAAMFTVESSRRYAWSKEPVVLRLNEPTKGSALYIKGSGPTKDLTVVINGVHRASIDAIPQLGGAIVTLPPGLEILDIRLEAGGSAQARGVVLVD